MKHLLLVSIGPVQEFIANARRTRDLHFGSWLISELSRAAAYQIDARQGYLIFPAPAGAESLNPRNEFNVANRILAIIEQEPQHLAHDVHTAVYDRLHAIKDKAYEEIHLPPHERSIADQQIDNLIEFVWVSLPYDGTNYRATRQRLEALMAARKNTYNFKPVTWGAPVPKSSLDGQLESVIPESEYPPRNATPSDKLAALQRLYNHYRIAGLGESLSGVDLLKRRGESAFGLNFPRTSHIAALPFLQRMRRIEGVGQSKLKTTWDDYINTLDKLATVEMREHISGEYPVHPILAHYDGAFLFEDRLVDLLHIPLSDKKLQNTVLQAQVALQKFYDEHDAQFSKIGLAGKARPSTYYALLEADGDSMGDLIDALAEQGHEQHHELSQALSRFAESVRGIVVKDHQGALVYSGGDDVLAFVPLHTVLSCAVELKKRFYEELHDLAARFNLRPPTLSMGIAIMHHLDSLREARRLALDAEKQAKRVDGKDALAITLSKRGGEDYNIVGKWGNIDLRLSQLVDYCRAASIPAGMAYELRDLVLRLSVPQDDEQYAALQNVIRFDTLRILMRKLTVPAGKLPPEKVEEIELFLRAQLDLPPKKKKGELGEQKDISTTAQVSIETFINELVIAQMLAQAAELAQEGV